MPYAVLKQDELKRFGAMKPQVANIEHRLDSLGDLDVDAGVVDEDSGINEIRLTLDLAAAKTRKKTIRLHQSDTGLSQTNSAAIEKGKLTSDEVRIVQDRIEARSLLIGRVLVTLGPEERTFET